MQLWPATSNAYLTNAAAHIFVATHFFRGSRVAEKAGEAVRLSSELDLAFVHRDANNAGAQARYLEIKEAVERTLPTGRWIAVVHGPHFIPTVWCG